MTRRVAASALFALTLASPLLADPPDFSGRWALVDPAHAPSAPDRLVINQTSTHVTRTARGAPMDAMAYKIIVERHAGVLVQTEQYDVGLVGGVVGGIGRGEPGGDSPYRQSGSRWDADSLVIEKERGINRAAKRIPQLAETESWSFDAQGELVVARTVRTDDGPPATTVFAYQREK